MGGGETDESPSFPSSPGCDGKIKNMDENQDLLKGRVAPRMLESAQMQRCTLKECQGACCIFGVWLDLGEVERIQKNSALIAPFLEEDLRDPALWFAGFEDEDPQTPSGRVIHSAVETNPEHYGGTACIFLRRDAKCALQVAAVENGMHPWSFKPFYCILHPLDLDDQGRITIDATAELLAEKGSCLVPANTEIPLAETFAEELEYLLGAKAYHALLSASRQGRVEP
jgi:Fe-S-cluster containining protein